MAGYTRQSSFVDGDTITAALFNDEYNQLVNVFSNTSGHKHDGTAAEGPVIGLIGDAGETSPNNKVLIDTTNNYIEFYVEVSSAPVQQLYIADGAIVPVTDNDIDLGTSSLEFKNLYLDGTAKIDTLTVDEAATIGTTLGVTGATTLSSTLGVTGATTLSSTLAVTGATTLSSTLAVTGTSTLTGNVTTTNNLSVGGNLTVTGNATISGNLTFGDADTDSINLAAEIDSDIIPNTDGTYDLGTSTKEWRNLYIDGTANIDSLVADTADINAGTIDNTVIGGTTAVAGSFTTATATTGNITTVNATTVDTTNIEVTNLKAKDGTSAGSIADSTGVVTLASSVLTTTDINGGTIDGVTIGGTTAGAVTFTDLSDGTITIANFIDDDTFGTASATTLPTSESVKAYVDAQVTAQDLDFQGDSGGALSIDLDSETLTIAGGTGIDTSGATNTLTVSIDSTVATLTGTQTLTNKTLTSPDVNTPDIDGGTMDGTVIGGTTPAAADFTTMDTTGNASVGGNLTVTGDLTINGTTTTVNSTTVTIDDPIFTLGGDTAPVADDNKDRGIEFRWHNGTAAKVGFFGYDDSASVFTFIPDATNTSEVFSGSAGNVAFGNIAGTLTTAAQPNITSLGTLTGLTTTGDINFGDNDKATFGASGDLEIYHSGNDSFIRDAGTGDLYIRSSSALRLQALSGENYAVFTENGAATFYYDNSTKLATTSTGIDVTGTVTADGLTVDASTTTIQKTGDNPILEFKAHAGTQNTIAQIISSRALTSGTNSQFYFKTNDGTSTLNRVRIQDNGDISFYEDTGTTAKLFWDASAESLGIGTTSPSSFNAAANNLVVGSGVGSEGLTIYSANNSYGSLYFADGTTGAEQYAGWVDYNHNTNFMRIATNGSEAIRIDSSGNVGIGTSSPEGITSGVTSLSISDVGSKTTGDKTGVLAFKTNDGSYTVTYPDGVTGEIYSIAESVTGAAYGLGFVTGTISGSNRAERLRIDNVGNVGIGTSSPDTLLELFADNPVLRLRDSKVKGNTWAAGDALGGLEFYTSDTTGIGTHTVASIKVVNGGQAVQSPDGEIVFSTGAYNTAASEVMRIDSSGNLLVGKNSNAISGQSNSIQSNSMVSTSGPLISHTTSAGVFEFNANKVSIRAYGATAGTGYMAFNVGGGGGSADSEAMRIDSSGNLLVGQSSTAFPGAGNTTTGISVSGQYDAIFASRASGVPIALNRNTDDGDIAQFRKDGTIVGSIGVDYSDNLYISGNSSHAGFMFSNNEVYPYRDGNYRDAELDLGASSGRWRNLYLSGVAKVDSSAYISQGALTSSSGSVAWDAAAKANAYYATTENTTFAAPTNAVEGAIISVEIAQGATAYTVAWNTVFEFAASTAPTVTATANKTDIFSFRYNGSVWQEIGRTQNLAQT